MALGYLDNSTVIGPLHPLVLLSDDSSEHYVVKLERILHSDYLVLQSFIRLRELQVEDGVTEETATSLPHVRVHRVVSN